MTDHRQLVLGRVLPGVLDAEAPVRTVMGADGTWAVDIDADISAFGFTEAPSPETPAESAARLVDLLTNELPDTRRYWGRPMPECPSPGHRHALEPRIVDDVTLTLACPRSGAAMSTIDLSP